MNDIIPGRDERWDDKVPAHRDENSGFTPFDEHTGC